MKTEQRISMANRLCDMHGLIWDRMKTYIEDENARQSAVATILIAMDRAAPWTASELCDLPMEFRTEAPAAATGNRYAYSPKPERNPDEWDLCACGKDKKKTFKTCYSCKMKEQ